MQLSHWTDKMWKRALSFDLARPCHSSAIPRDELCLPWPHLLQVRFLLMRTFFSLSLALPAHGSGRLRVQLISVMLEN